MLKRIACVASVILCVPYACLNANAQTICMIAEVPLDCGDAPGSECGEQGCDYGLISDYSRTIATLSNRSI